MMVDEVAVKEAVDLLSTEFRRSKPEEVEKIVSALVTAILNQVRAGVVTVSTGTGIGKIT